MSKTRLLVHLVFATGERKPTLNDRLNREQLYNYIFGILANKKCFLHAIGGIENHIHILFDLHPSVALAVLVKDLKIGTNKFIKGKTLFPEFLSWCSGYYAGTLSPSQQEVCINYIRNQEEHHRKKEFDDEMKTMASRYQFEYMEEDWT